MIEPGYLDIVSSVSPLAENISHFHQNISLSNDHCLSTTLINFPRHEAIDDSSINLNSVNREDNVDTIFSSQNFLDNTVSLNLNDLNSMKDLNYNCDNDHVHSSSGLVTPPDTIILSNDDNKINSNNIIHQTLPDNADVLIASKLKAAQSCPEEINGLNDVTINEVLNEINHKVESIPYDSIQPNNRSTLTTPVPSEHENSDFPCIEPQDSDPKSFNNVSTDYTHYTAIAPSTAPIETTHILSIPNDVTHIASPLSHSPPNEHSKPDPKFPDSVEPQTLSITSPTDQPFPQHLSNSPTSTSSPATSISFGIYNNNNNQTVNVKSEPLVNSSSSTCDDAEYAAAAIAAVDSVVLALVGNKTPTSTSFDPSLMGTGTDRLYSLSLAPPARQSSEVPYTNNNLYTQSYTNNACNHALLNSIILSGQPQPEYLTCPTCQKTLSTKILMEQHREAAVNEEAKHMCQTCGRSFVREDKLKRHIMSIHTMEKPHVCHICTKAFSRKDKLKDHVKHHDRAARNFECAQCMAPFVQKSDLNRHIRGVHQGEPGVGINMTIRRKVPGSSPARSSRKKRSLNDLNGIAATTTEPSVPQTASSSTSKEALALRLLGVISTGATTTTTTTSTFQMQQQMAALHAQHHQHAHPFMMLPSAATYPGQTHHTANQYHQGHQFMALAAAAVNQQQKQQQSGAATVCVSNPSVAVTSSPMMVLTQIAANQAAVAAAATPASQQQVQQQAQLSYQYQQQLLQHHRNQQTALAAGGYTQPLVAQQICQGSEATSLQEQQQHQLAYRQQMQAAAAAAAVAQQRSNAGQYPPTAVSLQQQSTAAAATHHPQSAFFLPGTAAAAAAANASAAATASGTPTFFCHPEMTGLILSSDPTTQFALAAAHMQAANSNHNGTVGSTGSAFTPQQPACALSGLQVVANVFGGHQQAVQQQQIAAHQQQLYAATSYQQQAAHFQQHQHQRLLQQQAAAMQQQQQQRNNSATATASVSAATLTNQTASIGTTATVQHQPQQLIVQDATATANYQLAAFTNAAAAAALYQQQQVQVHQQQQQQQQQQQVAHQTQQGLVLAYQQQQAAAAVAAQHHHQQAVAMQQQLAAAAAASQQHR